MNISNTKRESPRGIEYLFDHIRAKGFVNQVASFRNNNSKFRNRFTGTAAVLDFEQHPHGRREGNAFVADQCQDLNSRFCQGRLGSGWAKNVCDLDLHGFQKIKNRNHIVKKKKK